MTDQSHTSEAKHPSSHKPEWDIPMFYQRSWDVVKKHPVIWLFGLAALTFSGGSMNFNNFNPGSDSKDEKSVEEFVPRTPIKDERSVKMQDTDEEVSLEGLLKQADEEMADTTDEELFPVEERPGKAEQKFDQLKDVFVGQFSQVPAPIYMLLFLEIAVFVLSGIVIGIVAMNWSEAGLYRSFHHFVQGKPASVSTISTESIKYVIPTFKYNILSIFVMLGFVFLALIAAIVSGISYAATQSALVVIVVSFVITGLFIYLFVKQVTALAWGKMFLFLENTGARGGYSAGLAVSKGKGVWAKTFRLTVINLIASMIVAVLAVLPLGVLIVIPVISMVAAKSFSFFSIPFFILAAIVGVPLMMFINVMMKCIVTGTWYFGYQFVKQYRHSAEAN